VSTCVLVHGAWHGAWCWYKLAPRLERAGHAVCAPDLPAHGRDPTPATAVTFEDYVDRIESVVEERNEPVALVGHSMGGAVVTQVAERYPERIETLVYLTGFLLPDGIAPIDIVRTDEGSQLSPAIETHRNGCRTIRDGAVERVLYHDCDAADVWLCQSLLRPEPPSSLTTPVETTSERFGSVPRVFVECRDDRAFSPAAQAELRKELPCETVFSLNAGHAPFFATPDALAECLVSVMSVRR